MSDASPPHLFRVPEHASRVSISTSKDRPRQSIISSEICPEADPDSCTLKMKDLKTGTREYLDHYRKPLGPNFVLTPNNQQSSKFMQCPAEVRCAILTILLHDNDPLEDVQLSSQLLRTCQTLYREGKGVLYCSNTLVFRLRHRLFSMEMMHLEIPAMKIVIPIAGQYCDAFDTFRHRANVKFDHDFEQWLAPSLFDEVSFRPDPYNEEHRDNHELLESMLPATFGLFFEKYPLIEQFPKLQLNIRTGFEKGGANRCTRVFFCLRMLDELVHNKVFVVNFEPGYPSITPYEYIELLQMCRSLTCRSLDFHFPDSTAYQSDIDFFSKEVKALVEGNQPVFDSWRAVIRMRRELSDKLNSYSPYLDLTWLESAVNDAFYDFHKDARFYSKAAYEDRRIMVLQDIEAVVHSSLRDQMGADTKRSEGVRALINEIQEYLRSLIETYEDDRRVSELWHRIDDGDDHCMECDMVSKFVGSKYILRRCHEGCWTDNLPLQNDN